MKIGAVVQARTASTRLPRKVLKDLPYGSGTTVLEQVLRRIARSRTVTEVVVATTTDPADDAVSDVARRAGVSCFRGSSHDVLERYYQAARCHQLDVIVRITADCPCHDPEVIDLVVGEHLRTAADFTTNCLVRTFLHGVDTEVLGFAALERAHREATRTYERQHVCPFIYKTRPDAFRVTVVRAPRDLAAPDIRATLDTPEDYTLLCAVFDALDDGSVPFGARDIIALFRRKPWLRGINCAVVHKKVLATLEEEIGEAMRLMQLQELNQAKGYLELSWSRAARGAAAGRAPLVAARL
jgi:spore coat polysaccharide biosynthesis protein SpsF